MTPKRSSESATEMVQTVLTNDANPLALILGGTVMHLIDIAAAPTPRVRREKRRLRDVLEPQDGPIEIDTHPVLAQELMADDPTELKAEQRRWRIQVQHHHREVLVADRVERQIDPRHQE